jgi:hypothetical protein
MKAKGDADATATPAEPNENSSVQPENGIAKSRQPTDETRVAIDIDDSHVVAAYANFCRVSSTPEELILDLGLNPQPLNPASTRVSMSQRIIMNHFTAKRLLAALSAAVQRHESVFGVLETDVRRRVTGR